MLLNNVLAKIKLARFLFGPCSLMLSGGHHIKGFLMEKRIVTRKFVGFAAAMLALLTTLTSAVLAAEPTKDSLEIVQQNVNAKKAILVDVREKSEWDKGHIAGSVLMPLSELKQGVDSDKLAEKLPSGKIVYTFCVKGLRSCTAADYLKQQGYDVRPLKPGYGELLKAGFAPADSSAEKR